MSAPPDSSVGVLSMSDLPPSVLRTVITEGRNENTEPRTRPDCTRDCIAWKRTALKYSVAHFLQQPVSLSRQNGSLSSSPHSHANSSPTTGLAGKTWKHVHKTTPTCTEMIPDPAAAHAGEGRRPAEEEWQQRQRSESTGMGHQPRLIGETSEGQDWEREREREVCASLPTRGHVSADPGLTVPWQRGLRSTWSCDLTAPLQCWLCLETLSLSPPLSLSLSRQQFYCSAAHSPGAVCKGSTHKLVGSRKLSNPD